MDEAFAAAVAAAVAFGLVVASGFFFLAIMIAFTLADLVSRGGWVRPAVSEVGAGIRRV